MRNNDANEVPIEVHYNPGDPYMQHKKDMISDGSDFKKFRVTDNLRETNMFEFFSWARFVEFDENYTVLIDYEARAAAKNSGFDDEDEERFDSNKGFKAKELPPLSIRNESKVMLRMKLECMKVQDGYPTTLEEDLEILKNDDEGNGPVPISENYRNAVLMRSGEKKVLKYLIETVDLMMPLFEMNLQEAKKAVKTMDLTEDQSDYIKSTIFILLRKVQ